METEKTLGFSPTTEHEFVEDKIIIKTKRTFEMFLADEKPAELNMLYDFYYHTAKWQKTNRAKATDGYVMKGLKWGRDRLAYAKGRLIEMGLIEKITSRTPAGEIKGHYIKLKYMWSDEKVQEVHHTHQNPHVDTPTSGSQPTNALSSNNINALNSNNVKTDEQISTEQEKPKQADLKSVMRFYGNEYKKRYGVYPANPNWGKIGSVLKPVMATLSNEQIFLLIKIYFKWKGANGDSTFIEKRLQESCYPLEYLPSYINAMVPYITNVMKINFNSLPDIARALR